MTLPVVVQAIASKQHEKPYREFNGKTWKVPCILFTYFIGIFELHGLGLIIYPCDCDLETLVFHSGD